MLVRCTTVGTFLMAGARLCAQATGELDVNNIRAVFVADGMLREMEVPNGSGNTITCYTSLWMGGHDAQDSLHVAAVRFNQLGEDYWPGPLSVDGTASTTGLVSNQWDHVWKVETADAEQHEAYCACLDDPNCDESILFPGYQAPAYFDTWPAQFPEPGYASNYAPFIDHNGDGLYSPGDCDVPCSPGDQSLYFVFNDKLNAHTESGGVPIGVEVQTRPFAYTGQGLALENTIFIEYRLINRSSTAYSDFHVGVWSDMDMFMGRTGCDVGRSLWYMYSNDTTINDQPLAMGATLLCGLFADPDLSDTVATGVSLLEASGYGINDGTNDNERQGMMNFVGYEASGLPWGDPVSPADYYDRLHGIWNDGSSWLYGGNGHYFDPLADTNTVARFLYPGNSDPQGLGTAGIPQPPWYQVDQSNPDERTVGSMGPFTLMPGDVNRFLIAFTYASTSDIAPTAVISALQARVDSVRTFADSMGFCQGSREALPCEASDVVGIADVVKSTALHLFPVPASGSLTITTANPLHSGRIRLIDALGRTTDLNAMGSSMVWILDVSGLAPGPYTLTSEQAHGRAYGRFIKL